MSVLTEQVIGDTTVYLTDGDCPFGDGKAGKYLEVEKDNGKEYDTWSWSKTKAWCSHCNLIGVKQTGSTIRWAILNR